VTFLLWLFPAALLALALYPHPATGLAGRWTDAHVLPVAVPHGHALRFLVLRYGRAPRRVRVETHFWMKPVPSASYDWLAIDRDTYDGAPDSGNHGEVGHGATEAEAIADLLDAIVKRGR
jgi:hypothetical protein